MKFRTIKPLTILSTLLIIILCFTASASAFFVSSEKTHVGKIFFSNAFFTRNFSPLTAENTPVKNYDDKKNASVSLLVSKSGASSALQGSRLQEHLRQLEKYGQGGMKELENGRIRYYGEIIPAKNSGEMAGRRLVREWDPATGEFRTWHETLDHNNKVRQVRPEFNDGTKTHYTFDKDGNYTGSW